MPLNIIRQDITKVQADAIVNAANTALQMGGGVCGAIFRAAGIQRMQEACDKLAPIQVSEAVITPGFDLPAKHVIHAAGPVHRAHNSARSEQMLRATYLNALELAHHHRLGSIAFPLISSGIYGFPKELALSVARTAIQSFLQAHDMEVLLVVYDAQSFVVSQGLLGEVESYLDRHFTGRGSTRSRRLLDVEYSMLEETATSQSTAPSAGFSTTALEQQIQQLDQPFSQMLLSLIDSKGKTDVEVYQRANLDRKLFSKIRTGGTGYTPSKRTAIALAVALELSLPEANALLQRAGFAFSRAAMFDVIVEYFIANGQYDIYSINEVLFSYDLPLLGGSAQDG